MKTWRKQNFLFGVNLLGGGYWLGGGCAWRAADGSLAVGFSSLAGHHTPMWIAVEERHR